MSTPKTPSTPHKHPLSPEWIHAITILLGQPLTSEVGQNIQKWIIYHANLNYIKFAFIWDPIQFEGNKHLQKYEETNGSISYLKSNTVKQLVSLKIYMTLLICQDRPDDQKYHPTHFIKGEQLFKLKAIDFNTALLNEMFENPRSKTTFRALMHKITPPSPSAFMRSPTHVELAPFKQGIKSDDPPQKVDISHLSDPTSTTTNLDETYPLDTSCEHLVHLDSPSLSSELQDTSSAENVEIEFLPEPEGKLDHTNLSPTDVFSAQHNYEVLNPTDNPSAVPTAIKATSDQTFNPRCAHNPMATQCNQYPNPNHNFALPQFMAQPNS